MNTKGKPRTRESGDDSLIFSNNETILESISDGVFIVDREWRIRYFNRAAEEITGSSRADAVGRKCYEVFKADICENDCSLKRTLETGKPIMNQSVSIQNSVGGRVPISISTAVFRSEEGEILGGAETFRDLTPIFEMRKELEGRFALGDIVSRTPKVKRILNIVPAVAASESTVLIQGETGTGKEVLARTIHSLSSRKDGPFIAVNCGALPDTLLESELFGYKAGAFTGATRDKAGRFALAAGGTIFLDEITDISPAMQVKLLRVIQERTYEPLGAIRSSKADCRIITASNKDLSLQLKEGKFRRDLFYRLNIVKIELPPLRERREDIPFLADHFLANFNRLRNRKIMRIAPDVMAIFHGYPWPGNIRELENAIEYAFILCSGATIRADHLPDEFQTRKGFDAAGGALHQVREAVEAQAIREALRHHRNNRLAAARDLGIHKSTLFRKARALGIQLPQQDGRNSRKSPAGR